MEQSLQKLLIYIPTSHKFMQGSLAARAHHPLRHVYPHSGYKKQLSLGVPGTIPDMFFSKQPVGGRIGRIGVDSDGAEVMS